MLSVHTILHPTDFSEQSRYAFGLACALARDYGARLIVMHVVPAGTTQLLALSEMGTQARTGSIKDGFWSDLREMRPTDPAVRIEHRLEDGEPAVEILRVAKEIQPDLIVMGTHGRTGLGRLLMGSVAEQVVRRAPCPVLTIKTPLREASRAPQAIEPTAALSPP
jgi:nucleotide-binding universal stress UspA family protein